MGVIDDVTEQAAHGAEAFGSAGEYQSAVEQLREAAAAYYNSDVVLMDDDAYDELARRVAATEAARPEWADAASPTTQVAAGVGSGDVAHTVPMLSLDNVFSADELLAWGESVAKRIGRSVGGWTVEPKMDGLAVAARYRGGRLTQLVTRGDGLAGEDVSHAIGSIDGLPAQLAELVDLEVRGEVLLTNDQLDRANELRVAAGERPFVNPRNGAAGSLRAKDRTYTVTLTFYGYGAVHLGSTFDGARVDAMRHSAAMGLLRQLGVNTTADSPAGMAVCESLVGVQDYVARLAERKAGLGFDVDGAVVKADAPADRDDAGFSSRAPRWGIAFKYPAEEKQTELLEVIPQVGRTGVITPRARVAPTFVGGTTIEYASMHNWPMVEARGYMLGDKCMVRRAGEVIPELLPPNVALRDAATVQPIAVPQVCPRCGADIDKAQLRWRCSRGRYCGLAESIRYAVQRDCLDVEGMGDKIVAQLVDRKLVADVADIFTLTRTQLLGLDRMGETSADKLLAQIEAAKAQPLSRVFCALGVLGTGRSMSRRIARHFGSMDAIRAASAEDFEAVDGIGPEKAPVIVAELAELADVIDKLVAAGVNMVEPGTAAAGDAPSAGELPLAGMTVVVTGAMTGPLAALGRTQMNELIERAGGKSSGSVSAKTSYLVAGEAGSSKYVKAEQLGVTILTPEEFAEKVAAFLG